MKAYESMVNFCTIQVLVEAGFSKSIKYRSLFRVVQKRRSLSKKKKRKKALIKKNKNAAYI